MNAGANHVVGQITGSALKQALLAFQAHPTIGFVFFPEQ